MAVFSLLATMTSAYAWFESIRNEEADNSDFYVKRIDTSINAISIHEFYGETDDDGVKSFAFNPNGVSVYADGSFNNNAATVSLNKYILEKPDHPVLILFENQETSGYEAQINFKTEYAYLGANEDFLAGKTKTKEELNALANKVTNGYYRVVEDESQSSKPYLYQYDGSALQSASFATYAALDTAANRIAANNDKYFLVVDDEKHGNVATIYQYKDATTSFEMMWCDLGNSANNETNPLSSAVEMHYFTFSGTLASNTVSRDVQFEEFDETAQDYTYTAHTGESCIAIPKSGFTTTNRRSFTNFTNDDTFEFNNELSVFRGDVTGVSYIGVVVNYDKTALEYVFSHYLGHIALNNGLEFKCDWITEF